MSTKKKLSVIAILTLSVFIFQPLNAQDNIFKDEIVLEETNTITSELIINLTSDATASAHSTLMGLHLAQKALKNGMDVTIFLNVSGVKLMSNGADKLVFHNENLHEVLKSIMKDGGTIIACPHCMEVHEIQKENLLKGIKVEENNMLMNKLKGSPTVFTY